MRLTKLNPSARMFAKALIEKFPQFRRNLSIRDNDDFETFIWSPPGSNAGALVCQSFEGAVWVRFAAGRTGCCCDSTADLLKTVRNIVAGNVVIAVVMQGNRWVETSLRPDGTRPALKRGQTVATYSWRPSRPARKSPVRAMGKGRRRLTG